MLNRSVAVMVFVSELASAPLQCRHPPEPSRRLEETGGEALWSLAMRFNAKHDRQGEREALKMLVERYPSNRRTSAAKERLQQLGDAGR